MLGKMSRCRLKNVVLLPSSLLVGLWRNELNSLIRPGNGLGKNFADFYAKRKGENFKRTHPKPNKCSQKFCSPPAPLRGKDDDDIALVIDSGRIIESDQILSLVCPSSIYIEPRLGTQ